MTVTDVVAVPAEPGTEEVALRVRAVTKRFPGTLALNQVDFELLKGKVNVLVGENGAGKSTLMKILAGAETPSEGTLEIDGQAVTFRSPRDAEARGIRMIHQELSLFPNLSVTDNIHAGSEMTGRFNRVRFAEEVRSAREVLAHLEEPIDPATLVGNLRLGQQQLIEIARALAHEVRILIMDEPTSALSARDTEVLFRVIRELQSAGVTIIYISHKLDEVMRIGDRVTVLRDGRVVAQALISEIDIPWIIQQMVGRSSDQFFHHEDHKVGDVVLRTSKLSLAHPTITGRFLVNDVTFELRAGEILGVYGLLGAGRTELLECLLGVHPHMTGTIELAGRPVRGPISARISAGFALVPEDRQSDALVQTMNVEHNLTLAYWRAITRPALIDYGEEHRLTQRMVGQLSIRMRRPTQPIGSLSGGNQQKVVVGRALLVNPQVLLMDEPTRGIDVGAKSEIFGLISALAAEGKGIVFVTSELLEVLAISDRIMVMAKGAVTAEFTRDEATQERLVNAAAGQAQSRAEATNAGA
ncbi:MAG TPA: sugar ABC transporter ATP-binding protein [Candidatus Saccharimonadales bacterium]|nr:sugar ABC transporter ATP-binding protein [Candidatus Saccharimonadales bacterium]